MTPDGVVVSDHVSLSGPVAIESDDLTTFDGVQFVSAPEWVFSVAVFAGNPSLGALDSNLL